jgi:putative acetyltransferase
MDSADSVNTWLILPEPELDPHQIKTTGTVCGIAFADPAYAALPASLRALPTHRPAWSFAALADGEVIGHVMVSMVDLVGEEGSPVQVPSLSPLAVLPGRQRRGVGTALIEAVARAVGDAGEPFLVLEGSPAYYGGRGFQDAREHGVTLSLPDWAPREAGQLRPLPAYRRIPGRIVYPRPMQAVFDALEGEGAGETEGEGAGETD